MENLILECKGVTKSFVSKKDKKDVLKGINLTIEAGKIYGLVGRNGVGKTTLLSIMTGQNAADAGEITINGKAVWENEEVLEKLCFSREIIASAESGIATLKTKDYLRTAATYYKFWDQAMADELVKEFEIDIKQPLIKLSKGMLSLVTIIVALASKAPFTILDEPVAGLDVFARRKFYQLLLDEYTETGRTFVISTHIIEEASDILEEVIILHNGRILLKENTQELIGRTFRVSGLESEVDKAVKGLKTFSPERTGRGKGITVLLEEGDKIDESCDVSVQPLNLSEVFVALCAEKEAANEK